MADEIRKQLEAIQIKVAETANTKSVEEFCQFYTEDAVVIPAGGPIRGREAIIKYFKAEFPRLGNFSFEKNLYFELVNDSTAITTDLVSTKDGNGEITGSLRTTVLWTNVDGKWLYSREVYNNGPVPEKPKSDLQTKLEKRLSTLCTYYSTRDYDSAVAVFTEDCTFVPEGGEIAVGRDGVRVRLKAILESTSINIVPDGIFYIKRLNDTKIYTNCCVKRVDTDGKVTAIDRSCVIWKEIDGEWFVFYAIFNSKQQ